PRSDSQRRVDPRTGVRPRIRSPGAGFQDVELQQVSHLHADRPTEGTLPTNPQLAAHRELLVARTR
ncbi:MAG: hypothetical protein NTU77_03075, partial [Actinobacteria bacterium]|nr:hypothetical protein [Actinomycetota bacterium]